MENQFKLEVDRVYRIDNGGQLKGFADLSLSGQYVITGFKVVDGKKGLFVSMPAEMGKDGNWYDTFRPVSKEARQEINRIVLEAYNQQ